MQAGDPALELADVFCARRAARVRLVRAAGRQATSESRRVPCGCGEAGVTPRSAHAPLVLGARSRGIGREGATCPGWAGGWRAANHTSGAHPGSPHNTSDTSWAGGGRQAPARVRRAVLGAARVAAAAEEDEGWGCPYLCPGARWPCVLCARPSGSAFWFLKTRPSRLQCPASSARAPGTGPRLAPPCLRIGGARIVCARDASTSMRDGRNGTDGSKAAIAPAQVKRCSARARTRTRRTSSAAPR